MTAAGDRRRGAAAGEGVHRRPRARPPRRLRSAARAAPDPEHAPGQDAPRSRRYGRVLAGPGTALRRDGEAWVEPLKGRCDLSALREGALSGGMLADLAQVARERTAERRATFTHANVLAEVHRQLRGLRFASYEDRLAVAECTAQLAARHLADVLGAGASPRARPLPPLGRHLDAAPRSPPGVHDREPARCRAAPA